MSNLASVQKIINVVPIDGADAKSCYNLKNEIGNTYGKLTVISRSENSKYGIAKWLCRCECGNYTTTSEHSLRNKQTKSCGCLGGGTKRSGDSVFSKLLSLSRWQAEKAGVPFELTLTDIKGICTQRCSYCGDEPYLEKFAYHRTRYSLGVDSDEKIKINGIDKVIPTLGYVISNCVPCCKYCNRAKSDLSIEHFKELITKIYKNIVL